MKTVERNLLGGTGNPDSSALDIRAPYIHTHALQGFQLRGRTGCIIGPQALGRPIFTHMQHRTRDRIGHHGDVASVRPKIPHIRNFERSWPSDVGLNSGSGFASFGEPVVLGDQLGQHSTTIALIRANWTHRCRESDDPAP